MLVIWIESPLFEVGELILKTKTSLELWNLAILFLSQTMIAMIALWVIFPG